MRSATLARPRRSNWKSAWQARWAEWQGKLNRRFKKRKITWCCRSRRFRTWRAVKWLKSSNQGSKKPKSGTILILNSFETSYRHGYSRPSTADWMIIRKVSTLRPILRLVQPWRGKTIISPGGRVRHFLACDSMRILQLKALLKAWKNNSIASLRWAYETFQSSWAPARRISSKLKIMCWSKTLRNSGQISMRGSPRPLKT